MCGIVGVIAKNKAGLFKVQTTMFEQLLWADQLRGTDGTGIFYDAKSGIKVLKAPEDASILSDTKEFSDAISEAINEGHFLIGHNRAATKGKLVWENTHPFTEGNITLVHNGTLLTHKNLDGDVEVDSHAICKHMAVNGHLSTLKEVDGAFALVWHDSDKKEIHLARNTQRPLNLVETTSSWIVCSEAGLGVWIASRNNQKVESVIPLETEHVYTFSENDLSSYTKTKVDYFVWKGGYSKHWDFYDTPTNNHKTHQHKQHKGPDRQVVDQRSNKSTIRAWGAKVVFSPHKAGSVNKNKEDLSAIIYDQDKKLWFMKGRMVAEPLVELRHYGDWDELYKNRNGSFFEGIVASTKITKNRVIHTVTNVVCVGGDVLQLPDKRGWSSPTRRCSFCDCEVDKKDVKWMNGMALCPSCFITFEDAPELLSQCGTC